MASRGSRTTWIWLPSWTKSTFRNKKSPNGPSVMKIIHVQHSRAVIDRRDDYGVTFLPINDAVIGLDQLPVAVHIVLRKKAADIRRPPERPDPVHDPLRQSLGGNRRFERD